jgi:hypothetical protein
MLKYNKHPYYLRSTQNTDRIYYLRSGEKLIEIDTKDNIKSFCEGFIYATISYLDDLSNHDNTSQAKQLSEQITRILHSNTSHSSSINLNSAGQNNLYRQHSLEGLIFCTLYSDLNIQWNNRDILQWNSNQVKDIINTLKVITDYFGNDKYVHNWNNKFWKRILNFLQKQKHRCIILC